MRHRMVLNLYDTDPNHEELLIYLEGIEGSTRQKQAMLQMLMIGFRVVSYHESGDEAFYSVRNPDAVKSVRKLTGPGGQARPSSRPRSVIEGKPQRTQERQAPLESIVPESDAHVFSPVRTDPAPDSTHRFAEQNGQEDEFNTLRILKMMDEGDENGAAG